MRQLRRAPSTALIGCPSRLFNRWNMHDTLPWQDMEQLRTDEADIFERMGWRLDSHGQPRVPDRIVQELIQRPAPPGQRPGDTGLRNPLSSGNTAYLA